MEEEHSIVIAGFGGQGVLFAGLVLCRAGMNAGLNVAWIPSYGPEMRGGTANCTVILSREEIGSPVVSRPTSALVMNEPSLVKYCSRVQRGGTLVVNRSLSESSVSRADLRVVDVPANAIAAECGSERTANMVALGALVQATGVLPLSAVEAALEETLSEGNKRTLAGHNLMALRRGAAAAAGAQDLWRAG
jgi:2-oxoglutarate ferredoxin oxidoreductase subunit gamma